MKKSLIIGLALIVLLVGCKSNSNEAETPISVVEGLKNRLATLQDSGLVAFGHHDDVSYGHTWVAEEGRSDVKEVCGDYPAVFDWDLGWIELELAHNLDKVPFDFIRAEIVAHHKRGGINTVSWHLQNPATAGTSWDITDKETVKKAVTEGEAANDSLKLWCERAAIFVNSLKDEDGNLIPIVFRPWHEHNGKWFWWGADCTPEDYKKLWQITREAFDAQNVTNVVWAYSPDAVESAEEYAERYPGDEYVDLVGTDVYHFDGEAGLERYLHRANTSLAIATQFAKDHNKLLAFTETGSEGLPMANWWTDVLLPIVSKYPVAYVVVWRNAHDMENHYYAPFVGEGSVESFLKFYNDSTIVFEKEMREIK